MKVVQDYLQMGVPNVWILDPWNKQAYIADAGGLRVVTDRIGTADGRVVFRLEEVFG
jgi:Uma2 family endonuclease